MHIFLCLLYVYIILYLSIIRLSGAEFVVHVSVEVWLALGVFEGEERNGIVRFFVISSFLGVEPLC